MGFGQPPHPDDLGSRVILGVIGQEHQHSEFHIGQVVPAADGCHLTGVKVAAFRYMLKKGKHKFPPIMFYFELL